MAPRKKSTSACASRAGTSTKKSPPAPAPLGKRKLKKAKLTLLHWKRSADIDGKSETPPPNVIIIDKRQTLIGRGRECDAMLRLFPISRRHLQIDLNRGDYFILDLSLNSVRIERDGQPSIPGIPGVGVKPNRNGFTKIITSDVIHLCPGLSYKFEVCEQEDDESESPLSAKNGAVSSSIKKGNKSKKKRSPSALVAEEEEDHQDNKKQKKEVSSPPLRSLSKSDLIRTIHKLEEEKLTSFLNRLDEKKEWAKSKDREFLEFSDELRKAMLDKFMGALESEFCCSICSDVFVVSTVVDCAHTFCSYCIKEWTKKKNECPICRSSLTRTTKHVEMDNYVNKVYEFMSEEVKAKRAEHLKERAILQENQDREMRELRMARQEERNTEGGARAAAAAAVLPAPQAEERLLHGAHGALLELFNNTLNDALARRVADPIPTPAQINNQAIEEIFID